MKKLLSILFSAALLATTAAHAQFPQQDTLIVVGVPPDTTITIFYSNALTDSTQVILTNTGAVSLTFCTRDLPGDVCSPLGALVDSTGQQIDTTILGLGGVSGGYYINVTNTDVELMGTATVMLKDFPQPPQPPQPPPCDPWCTTGNSLSNPVAAFLGTTSVTALIFKTSAFFGGGERMRITSAGKVGIGTPSPNAELDVIGTGLFSENVGIGTPTPLVNLHVEGTGFFSGRVGIGTYTPLAKLHVSGGDALFSGNVGIGIAPSTYKLNVAGTVNATEYRLNGNLFTTSQWQNSNANDIYYDDGKVVIGNPQGITSGPHSNFQLAVAGKIVSKSTYVTISNWQDAVFNEDYTLMTLEEMEKYYKQHRHLPYYPAEKEIIDNGLDLGSIASLQQKSIEEIMLYLVDMKKEMNTLKEKNTRLENEIQKLKIK